MREEEVLERFYGLLEKTPRKWRLAWGKALRTDGAEDCPLSATARMVLRQRGEKVKAECFPRCAVTASREVLGLPKGDLAYDIAGAADGNGSESIRKRLLQACGVKEKKEG